MNRMDQMFAATAEIYVDSVLLVREVKKYPNIYSYVMRRDPFAVCRAWEAIVNNLIPQFPDLDEDDQKMIRNNLRKRWSWMRCTLQRDLARGKRNAHKHLNWIKELEFLVPVLLQKRQAVYLNKIKSKEREKGFEYSNACNVTSTTPDVATSSCPSRAENQAIPCPGCSIQYLKQDDYADNEKLVNVFISEFKSEVFTTSVDRDVHFLYTLLHSFRQLSPEQKLLRKEKFNKILQI